MIFHQILPLLLSALVSVICLPAFALNEEVVLPPMNLRAEVPSKRVLKASLSIKPRTKASI